MPRHPTGQALGQLVRTECMAVVRALRGPKAVHARVHEARKAIRRCRALLALAEDGDAPFDVGAADRILQRVGDGLSRLRDAHAAMETAQEVGKQVGQKAWRPVVAALRERSAALVARELQADPGFARRVATVQGALHYIEQLPWEALTASQVRDGLQRQRRRVDNAARRASKHPDAEHLHRWRRKVRRLRMQVEAMPKIRGGAGKPEGTPKSKALHKLSDVLGREQDLHVLSALLRRLPGIEDRAGLRAQLQELAQSAA